MDGSPAESGGTVLVAADDKGILRTLAVNLKARGYEVRFATNGTQTLTHAARWHPDAVILDLGLADMDGLDIIGGLRGWTDVPIIMLSVRSSEAQRVAALDAGANDYITKPFGMEEFMARLRVALRTRPVSNEAALIQTPSFAIDLVKKEVRQANGAPVRLTGFEWGIVDLLARHPGQLVTQRQLMQQVWGLQNGPTDRIRVFMVAIRRKLEPDPSHPRYFLTEHGSGIRFVPDGAGIYPSV